MADNDIKQKIQLSGEKEYNNALKEAKRNLKTLRSELKAETAELGANATAQQKNETRMKSLQKQIREQEKIVKTYQEALKEVKDKYSDNEEAIAKWEVKLNDARASLANMRNELEGVGQGFQSIQNGAEMATVASKSVADSFGRLSEIGETISGSIEAAFSGLIQTARQTIEAIWADIVDLAAKSNNMVDLAGFWNTDVMTIQQYANAVQTVSGNLEDLSSLVTKINSADVKKVTELTGVSKENYKDQWKYAMAVMDALSAMNDDIEKRNDAAFEIFGGKQATKAFDLLNDWNKMLDNLGKFDAENGGYGLSSTELQNMSDLYDKVNGLKASWEALKGMAEVRLFGDLAINISTNAQNILDALLEYMNAGSDAERDAALEKITENVTAMFTTAADAILAGIESLKGVAEKLKTSGNPIAQALGAALEKIVETLEWFTKKENWDTVKTGFEAIIAVWAGAKIATAIGNLASFASHLATIRSAGGLFGALFGGGGSAAAASGAASGGGGFLSGLIGNITSGLGSVVEWVSKAGGLGGLPGVTGDMFVNQTNTGRALRDGGNVLEGAAQDLKEAADAIKSNAETFEDDWKNNAIVKFFTDRNDNANAAANGIDWRRSDQKGFVQEVLEDVLEDEALDRIYTDQDKENAIQDWWDAWRESAEDETSNFDWMQEVFGDEFGAVWDRIIQRLDELGEKQMELEDIPSEWWKTQGGNSGETDGLTSSDAKSMTAAVTQMPKAVAQSVSGLRVYLDGATVGRMVAPYVSQSIAYSIGG